jgi:hypothetical protein
MRQNFKGNKRQKEELRRKKQEEKRNKRFNKRTQEPIPGTPSSGVPGETAAPISAQDQ